LQWCYDARLKYFTIGSILKRGLEFKVNMKSIYSFGIYSLLNYLSYNDAIKKQDIILGAKGAIDPIIESSMMEEISV
jgi:hypothetical protein